MSEEVLEAEVVEGPGEEMVPVVRPPTLTVTPAVKAEELVERLSVIRQAMENAMQKDIDYGVIPGTDKPALLKPGAEKLGALFQLDVQVVNEKTWGPGDHLTVESKATVFHAPTGARLGSGEGMCTTREKKYGKRQQDRACPECGGTTIKRSKFEDKGDKGWYCFAKIGGCGTQFRSDDQRIVEQTTGEIDNPELPDLWNTVVKMAKKRAHVDAVLAVTGASALFTQDVEDQPAGDVDGTQPPDAPPPREGSDVPSEKQVGFLVRLLGQNGVSANNQELVRDWGALHLTGGREGTCSRAIEVLKSSDDLGKRQQTIDWLVGAAGKWAASQPDIPADTEGLPDA